MNAATVLIHGRRYRFIKQFQIFVASCFLILAVSGCAEMPSSPDRDKLSIGITFIQMYPSLAKDLHYSETQNGLVVVNLHDMIPSSPGTRQNIPSPAKAAGMREGDVITKIKNSSGKLIGVRDSNEFFEIYNGLSENEPAMLEILREGKAYSVVINRFRGKLASLIQPPARPQPRTLKVSASGNGDFRSIHGAMIASRPGDTILFGPGTYSGLEVFRNNLTIASEDPKSRAKIDGNIVITSMRGAKVQFLDIVGGANYAGINILNAETITIENCAISGSYVGIYSQGSKGVTLRNNRITSNGAGVGLWGSSFLVEGNLIEGNTMGEPGKTAMLGVEVNNSKGELSHNTIVNNKANFPDYVRSVSTWGLPGTGIRLQGDSNVSIYSNIINENNVGVFVVVNPQGKNPTYRIEYNDVYKNIAEGSWKIFATDITRKIINNNWDYTVGVNTVVEEAPLLSLSSWSHTTYAPNPPQVSQTNINSDPFFADPANGDYRLSADSPLIGRGRSGSNIGAFGAAGQKVGEGEFK